MATYHTFDCDNLPAPSDFEPMKPKRRKQKMTKATISYTQRGHKIVLTIEESDTAKLVEYMIPGTVACIEHSGGKIHDTAKPWLVCSNCNTPYKKTELFIHEGKEYCPCCSQPFDPAP